VTEFESLRSELLRSARDQFSVESVSDATLREILDAVLMEVPALAGAVCQAVSRGDCGSRSGRVAAKRALNRARDGAQRRTAERLKIPLAAFGFLLSWMFPEYAVAARVVIWLLSRIIDRMGADPEMCYRVIS
jgi:hypothetical protein